MSASAYVSRRSMYYSSSFSFAVAWGNVGFFGWAIWAAVLGWDDDADLKLYWQSLQPALDVALAPCTLLLFFVDRGFRVIIVGLCLGAGVGIFIAVVSPVFFVISTNNIL